jgi:hypothetical protein
MRRRMCLDDEPKSFAILLNYFLPRPLINPRSAMALRLIVRFRFPVSRCPFSVADI